MFIMQNDRDQLINNISKLGATAVTMLAEAQQGEVSHPATYGAGYLQGYIHGCDAACELIAKCDN